MILNGIPVQAEESAIKADDKCGWMALVEDYQQLVRTHLRLTCYFTVRRLQIDDGKINKI
jgi:hypothetical protein